MSTDEKKLYDILFPDDDNLYHINYAYYTGGTDRAISTLKSKIKDNYTALNIVEDKKQHGSFFIRVFQKDVHTFLNMIKYSKFKERKIPNRYISEIKILFGDSKY